MRVSSVASVVVIVLFLMVFPIAAEEATQEKASNSILATKQLIFDAKGNVKGYTSYMDDYPFPYFVIVRNLRSLPQALADALRQWFEAVNGQDE